MKRIHPKWMQNAVLLPFRFFEWLGCEGNFMSEIETTNGRNTSTEVPDPRLGFARQRAAQAWCLPTTEQKVMDTELAEAFATILVEEMYKPNLGCATTRELLDEISARSDLDYRTID
jgi:hypothetical protein